MLALWAGYALAAVLEWCIATFLPTGRTDLCATRSAVAFRALAGALVAVEVLPPSSAEQERHWKQSQKGFSLFEPSHALQELVYVSGADSGHVSLHSLPVQ